MPKRDRATRYDAVPAARGDGRRGRRAGAVAASLAAAVALLAACGSEGGADPSGAASDPSSVPTVGEATTSPAPTPDAPAPATPAEDPGPGVPPFPAGTAPQFEQDSRGPLLVFTDVRVAQHEGFDRIVMEFAGAGTPGWAVNYVDRAVLDGSGIPVRLDGDASLDIYAANSTAPAPGYYDGPRRLQPPTGGAVTDLFVGGTFEGTTQVLVGIDGAAAPFRVFTLSGPSRLVVDVVDAGGG